MTAGTEPLTERPAWKALKAHYPRIRDLHLRKLFADDPKRGERMTAEAAGIYLDYSKNRITAETLRLLLDLAEAVEHRHRAHVGRAHRPDRAEARDGKERDDRRHFLGRDEATDTDGCADPALDFRH